MNEDGPPGYRLAECCATCEHSGWVTTWHLQCWKHNVQRTYAPYICDDYDATTMNDVEETFRRLGKQLGSFE